MEVKVQIPQVDEVRERELSVGSDPVDGGEHLRGDDPGPVLEDDDEVVDGSVAPGPEHLQELGLQGQGQVRHGDGTAGGSCKDITEIYIIGVSKTLHHMALLDFAGKKTDMSSEN